MDNSTYLVQDGSIFSGIARSIDLFGEYTEYNQSVSAEEADIRGLQRDFQAIGVDLGQAFRTVQLEQTSISENGK